MCLKTPPTTALSFLGSLDLSWMLQELPVQQTRSISRWTTSWEPPAPVIYRPPWRWVSGPAVWYPPCTLHLFQRNALFTPSPSPSYYIQMPFAYESHSLSNIWIWYSSHQLYFKSLRHSCLFVQPRLHLFAYKQQWAFTMKRESTPGFDGDNCL